MKHSLTLFFFVFFFFIHLPTHETHPPYFHPPSKLPICNLLSSVAAESSFSYSVKLSSFSVSHNFLKKKIELKSVKELQSKSVQTI